MATTYNAIAIVAQDAQLALRIKACLSTQTQGTPAKPVSPDLAGNSAFLWRRAGQPGWGAAWASAVASNIQNIGSNETVITDAMILSGVQAVLPSFP